MKSAPGIPAHAEGGQPGGEDSAISPRIRLPRPRNRGRAQHLGPPLPDLGGLGVGASPPEQAVVLQGCGGAWDVQSHVLPRPFLQGRGGLGELRDSAASYVREGTWAKCCACGSADASQASAMTSSVQPSTQAWQQPAWELACSTGLAGVLSSPVCRLHGTGCGMGSP